MGVTLNFLTDCNVNAHKTKYMCFNQAGDISTREGNSLKLVDKFTYLGSSVSSTEKDIDMRLTKAWTVIDKLSIIWNQTWPIKWNAVSSRQRSCRYCCMDAPLGTNPRGNTPQSNNYTATCFPARKLSKLDEPDTQDTAGEAETSS